MTVTINKFRSIVFARRRYIFGDTVTLPVATALDLIAHGFVTEVGLV
jgi:hypothetical protein